MPFFGKKLDCPSSAELLEVAAAMFSHDGGKLHGHLNECDFCAAEMELYLRFPPEEEIVEPAPIPEHLFDLAESILKRKNLFMRTDRRTARRHG